MKNYTILSIPLFFTCIAVMAQKPSNVTGSKQSKGKSHLGAIGIYLPLGEFSASHVAGVGLDYAWSQHRYGNNLSYKSRVGFTISGGLNWFAGKHTTTAGYEFRYGSYFSLYAMPGILYNPFKQGNIFLAAGPVLNRYKGSTNVGLGVNLFTNYFISDNVSLGPGLIYKKRNNTNALWAATLRASYIF